MAQFTPRSSGRRVLGGSGGTFSRGGFSGGSGGGKRGGTSWSSLMALGAVAWIVVLLGTTARGVVKSVQLTRSVASLRAESLSVAARLDTVRTMRLAQDPARELERHAREDLGLAKEGEIIYRRTSHVAPAESVAN